MLCVCIFNDFIYEIAVIILLSGIGSTDMQLILRTGCHDDCALHIYIVHFAWSDFSALSHPHVNAAPFGTDQRSQNKKAL